MIRISTILAAGTLLLPMLAAAAIDGTVVNKTTGKPQAGADVTLIDLSKGMSPAATTKTDAKGAFRFDASLPGPGLVQANWQGVGYNRMLQPGAPTTGLEVAVYDSSAKPGTAKLDQDMILLEPNGSQINVREGFVMKNPGAVTYNDAKNGTLRFFLPEAAAGQASVTIQSQGMPIQRSPEKTSKANIYSVNYPVRPGETQFEVAYTVPATGDAPTFSTETINDAPVRLIVPAGVTLEGDGLEQLGQEPQSKAVIYGAKNKKLTVTIRGTGAMAASSGGGGDAAAASDESPQIVETLPRMYDRLYAVLALGLGILIIGFILQWRKRAPEPGTAVATSPAPRQPVESKRSKDKKS